MHTVYCLHLVGKTTLIWPIHIPVLLLLGFFSATYWNYRTARVVFVTGKSFRKRFVGGVSDYRVFSVIEQKYWAWVRWIFIGAKAMFESQRFLVWYCIKLFFLTMHVSAIIHDSTKCFQRICYSIFPCAYDFFLSIFSLNGFKYSSHQIPEIYLPILFSN